MRRRSRAATALAVASALLLSLFLFPPPDGHQSAEATSPAFGTNVRVDDSPGVVLGPKIAADSAGKLHAVWLDRRGVNEDIYYTNSSDGGQTWTASRRIDDAPPWVASWDVDVAVNKGGG